MQSMSEVEIFIMRGIEYYREYLHLLEEACNTGRKNYSYEYGSEHIGDYWLAICQDLRERNLALNDRGDLQIRQLPPLVPLMAEFREQIEAMKKDENDRNLANQHKIDDMAYGHKAYNLAKNSAIWNKWNITFSIIIAAGQIIQWIILIYKWQSNP